MSDTVYQPKNVIASFVNELGEERIIHRPKGRNVGSLRVLNPNNSPALRLNRAAATLIGLRIRAARQDANMTLEQLGQRAGLKGNPVKNYVFAIEKGARQEGIRFGTLFAIASALGIEAGSLLPTTEEVKLAAGVELSVLETLR